MSVAADRLEDLQAAVREAPRVLPRGGGTKPALSGAPGDVVSLDVTGLSGILEYDPGELTFTALAGTPVAEVSSALAEHGQYLPFDPPLTEAGATLGGVVAAGTSGPNAFRHGGVRDFLIGVRFIDGTGRLVTGGGKVVKNAAGFDLPKLMIGSAGRLGVLVQLSFKVFPRPLATTTVRAELDSAEEALTLIARLGRGPVELDAVDLEPPGTLVVRVGGSPETLPSRVSRLEGELGYHSQRLEGHADVDYWHDASELAWVPADSTLVRAGITPRAVPGLEIARARAGAAVRYSLGANVAWIAWPAAQPLAELEATLRSLGLAGIVLRGAAGRVLLGNAGGGAFATRVRAALDPDGRFLEL